MPPTSPPATSKTVRLAYFGRIGENNTSLLRNAGLAGVLKRSVSERANLINAMQIAGQRGWNLAERHEAAFRPTDSIRLELETDCGVTVWKARCCWASRG